MEMSNYFVQPDQLSLDLRLLKLMEITNSVFFDSVESEIPLLLTIFMGKGSKTFCKQSYSLNKPKLKAIITINGGGCKFHCLS